MPASRSVVSMLSRELGDFSLLSSRPALRAAACGGRPRPAAPRRPPAIRPHRARIQRSRYAEVWSASPTPDFGRRAWSSRNRSTRPRNTTAIVKSLAWHHCLSRSYCSTERRVGTVCHGPPALNCGEKGLNRSSVSDGGGDGVTSTPVRLAHPGSERGTCPDGCAGRPPTTLAPSNSVSTMSCSSWGRDRTALSSNRINSDICMPIEIPLAISLWCAVRALVSRPFDAPSCRTPETRRRAVIS
jgi:hypothetical protein